MSLTPETFPDFIKTLAKACGVPKHKALAAFDKTLLKMPSAQREIYLRNRLPEKDVVRIRSLVGADPITQSAAALLGGRGGRVKSPAKAAASRANGAKGGRKRKAKKSD